ncbi:MAG: 4Fe-4S binding protein [Betaproteobacteria bacterium]|nr:4Fe-4S binding protein [Betaproteobacteria bacterium]
MQLDADRCLRLRSRYSDCDQCAQACPPRVLRVSHERIELADGCLRCGQCSAACPTEALQIEGFAADPAPAAASKAPLHVDCWKVAASDSPRDAVRVPCLGGIAPHRLVRWHAASGGRQIVLLDRGWCDECRAGSGANHPAQEALAAARALLAALGVAEAALPRLGNLPLPRTRMPAEIPEPLAARPLSRREFFSGMTRAAARAIAPVVAGEGGERGQSRGARPGKVETTARSQLLAQAAALGKRRGRPLPAELFPALRVSDACRNHQVCATTCPTGALQAYANGDGAAAGIAFDAQACIACGDCTRACPEQALALLPQGDGEAPQGITVLTRWTLRECHDCGHEFADSGSSSVCPTCRKTRELTRASFSQLFGSTRNPHGERMPVETSAGTD